MWMIPSWAVGVAFIMVVVGTMQVVVRRLVGRGGWSRGRGGSEDPPGTAQALEDVQRRLAELEERVDFAERLLAKERDAERFPPPKREA